MGLMIHRTLVNRKVKKIPTFSSEDEEREFWSHADSTEYIDWSKAKERSLSRLKLTVRSISGEKRPPDSR
jgi:hypothetical protein